MDFIPELPTSEGFDNVLVIVDKLTKYAIFIPCTVNITEGEMAKIFFEQVISKFGIPWQVITDHDAQWRNDFWAEICQLMGMKRSLTTSYHPQADGQMEIMNQYLEISLRAFIRPNRDNWAPVLPVMNTSFSFFLPYLNLAKPHMIKSQDRTCGCHEDTALNSLAPQTHVLLHNDS